VCHDEGATGTELAGEHEVRSNRGFVECREVIVAAERCHVVYGAGESGRVDSVRVEHQLSLMPPFDRVT